MLSTARSAIYMYRDSDTSSFVSFSYLGFAKLTGDLVFLFQRMDMADITADSIIMTLDLLRH